MTLHKLHTRRPTASNWNTIINKSYSPWNDVTQVTHQTANFNKLKIKNKQWLLPLEAKHQMANKQE